MDAIEDSSTLWTLLSRPGWEIKPNPVKHLLKIKAPDYQEALILYTNYRKFLATWAASLNCTCALIGIQGMSGSAFKILAATPASQQKLYEDLIFVSLQKSVRFKCNALVGSDGYARRRHRYFEDNICKSSGFYIAETFLYPELRPIVDEVFSNPDKKLALTRMSDNFQLIVSASAARAMSSDSQDVVRRRTTDFWHARDYQIFIQKFKQDGSTGFEITYQATTNLPKTNPLAAWAQFTTSYRFFEIDMGGRREVYRLGEGKDITPINRPKIVS
ncbi:hypothetical protein IQ259_02245 [Fortiea sp. LEGE XX443]|uniref:hypothetical protein n=1 Tax=Fortiea sp. LEGE XX443 TaxID=1828611 RepID=UPI001882E95C|nr:hypothetical protein [Fortiea sp. LEGE XX443]MBE9003879.1 hypothetical protein [Fortiea sp. LEGE XX443]